MKTASSVGYSAKPFTRITQDSGMITCRLCRLSGKRATPGCEAAGTAYNDQIPRDSAPAENDYCALHPLRAKPVFDDSAAPPPRAKPVQE
jgi:penicillin-binding protein 1A